MESIIMEDVKEPTLDMSQLIEVRNALNCKSKIHLQENNESMSTQLIICNRSKIQFYRNSIGTREIILAVIVAFVGTFAIQLSIRSYTSIA